GAHERRFAFHMSWDWVQHGLGPMWKPFLIGCGITGAVVGLLGYGLLDLLLSYSARKKYRGRPGAASRQSMLLHYIPTPALEDARHARRKPSVLRHHDQAGAVFAVELEHQREHRLGVGPVEIARGLVRQHDGWPRPQCTRHRRALPLAAGELVRTMHQALA